MVVTQHVSSYEYLADLFTKGSYSSHMKFILSKLQVLNLFTTSNLRGDEDPIHDKNNVCGRIIRSEQSAGQRKRVYLNRSNFKNTRESSVIF